MRGWRPQGDGQLELVDGPFLQLIADAEQNPDDEYVMVIEEINRGNPAQIFGEMLTLLEADKRNEGEALALAYPRKPGERVHIPAQRVRHWYHERCRPLAGAGGFGPPSPVRVL